MWSEGKLHLGDEVYRYWVKHFEEGSKYGIDGGRISKLEIRHNGVTVVNYDRGWDIWPEDDGAKEAYEEILREFN